MVWRQIIILNVVRKNKLKKVIDRKLNNYPRYILISKRENMFNENMLKFN